MYLSIVTNLTQTMRKRLGNFTPLLQYPMHKLSSFLLVILWLPAFAQPLNKSKLDSFIDHLETHRQAMGSVAISEDGRIMYQRSFGFAYADESDTLANATNTLFRIGSITKTFTATLVAHLAEEGLLSFDDTLARFYPNIKNARLITIRHLLNHSSGIHNFTNDAEYQQYLAEAKSPQELLDIIKNAGSDFTPGEKHEYSNSNYVLLGLIAERVTGKSYQQLLESIITGPLKLKNTRVGAAINPQKNMAYSYTYQNGWQPDTETHMSIPLGAGAIISTPTDLLVFIHALRNGKIVSQEMADSLLPAPDNNFGMGLFAFPFNDRTAYGHNGGIDGFRSNVAHFDREEVAIAITLNGERLGINNIGLGMLSIYFNGSHDFPDFTEVKLSAQALEKFEGLYTNPNFPLDIKVFRENNQLFAQATGQQSFPLTATSKNKFTFNPAGIKVQFDAESGVMLFQQGALELTFDKSQP